MTDPFARRERHALCDLARALGPDASTLCEGWAADDLMAHLVVRERRPVAAAGNVLPPLSGLTRRAMDRQKAKGFDALVERYRTPAPLLRALPPVDEAMNGFELLVHHEDLRRGAADWEPRELATDDLDLLWKRLGRGLVLLGRRLPVPTVIRRDDTGAMATAKRGDDPVTISGPVVELVLFLFGRTATRGLSFDGRDDRVAAVRAARLGI